jgi:hypothetical protein
MSYIGNTATTQNFVSGTDYFSGNGSTTTFTLTRTPSSVNDIQVVVENVVQNPSTAYTISGNTITFTAIPPSGSNNIYVRYLSTIVQALQPGQGTVNVSALTNDLQLKQGASFKNRVHNGDFRIDQRFSGATQTPTTDAYVIDRWQLAMSSAASWITTQQSTVAPVGFSNSLKLLSNGANTPAAGTIDTLQHKIEGINIVDLAFGTSAAKSVSVSFWINCSVTGTFGILLTNGGMSRVYPTTYTINSANTWEYKTIVVPGDVTGTWATDTGIGMRIVYQLGTGSTYSVAAGGGWATQSGGTYGVTGTTNITATSGATMYITGVQLEAGQTPTAFDFRSPATELVLCQRYCYAVSTGNGIVAGTFFASSGTTGVGQIPVAVQPRIAPTGIVTNTAWYMNNGGPGGCPASSLNFLSANLTMINVGMTNGAGMTAGYSGWLYSSGTATLYTTGSDL